MTIGTTDKLADTPWVVGESVPWSVTWSAEVAFGLQRSTDFPGMIELVQEEKPGVGMPTFAVNHVMRNRRGMFQNLCHICGGPTKRWDRWLFPVETGGFVTMHDGEVRYGGNIPPAHMACAERAQRLCPHLKKVHAQPVRFPKEDDGRMIARTDVVPGMEQVAATLPKGVPVVMSCYRLFGARFSRQVQRLREAAGV